MGSRERSNPQSFLSQDHRFVALDAARGLAMLLVCLSHFGVAISNRDPVVSGPLETVGMIASPAFMLLSGSLLGYLTAIAGSNGERLRFRLVDRGLFLLLGAHLVIALSFYRHVRTWGGATRLTFMTDTIGASLIIGSLLLPRTTSYGRLLIAGGFYVISWLAVLVWTPSSQALVFAKEVLVGSSDQDAMQNFPFAPWFAVYLAATVLGESFARRRRAGALAALGRRMILLGPLAVLLALLVKIAFWLGHPTTVPDLASTSQAWRVVRAFTTPWGKHPPGLGYLLTFGGLASMMIGSVLLAGERGWLPGFLSTAAVAGRSSLMVFTAQFFIYNLIVGPLPLPSRLGLIPYFFTTVLTLWLVAWLWGRINGNRFFTLGFTAACERQDRAAALEATGNIQKVA